MDEAALRRFDAVRNRLWCREDARIVVVRHPLGDPGFHDPFLRWLERNFPAVRRHFELALLPGDDIDLGRARALVPWLQDPVDSWSPRALEQACALAQRCADRGIAVVNHPGRLANGAKRATADRLAAIGIRTPRTVTIDGARAVLPGRILIREDGRHGAPSLLLEAGRAVEPAAVRRFERPIAVEFVDTAGPDGLFRKYRCLVAGAHVVSVHLLAAREWEVRGHNKLGSAALLDEEAVHVAAVDRDAALFRRARHALDLDLVAFDYGRLPDGRIVVWEGNAFPLIRFGPRVPHLGYRDAPVHRSFAAMAGLYLDRAGLPVPDAIDRLRSYREPAAPVGLVVP